MQRRLIDDLVELEIYTEKISEAYTKCKQLMDRLLSASDKSFEVILDGKVYDFDVAFTHEEHIQLSMKRRQLIDALMLKAFVENDWSYVLAFAEGTDPLDMQCEIIKSEDLYPVLDENGEMIKSLALNEDAHVVKVQRFKVNNSKDLLTSSDDPLVEMIHFTEHLNPWQPIFDENDPNFGEKYKELNISCKNDYDKDISNCVFCQKMPLKDENVS